MDNVVLDASIAIGLCFEDQIDVIVLQTIEALRTMQGVVTPQWQTEVAEALLTAELRKKIHSEDREHFFNLLRSLQLEIDHEGENDSWGICFALATEHGIRIQEAQVLLLALRRKAPLASRSPELQHAAKKLGVKLVIQ